MSDDETLLRALRELGTDYEPDVTAISRRVQEPRALRSGRPVLLPAAAVLLVMGGIVLVTSRSGPDHNANLTSQIPIATGADTSSSKPAPTRIGPAVSATSTAGPTKTRPRTKTPPPTDSARVAVQPLTPAITSVNLTSPPLLDWLATGTRSDLKQVRAKTQPVITVDQPGSAASVRGPFRTSWSGGVPEEDHTDATDWLAAEGRAGLTVRVNASSHARTVVLYAGASDLHATLAVSGKGIASRRTQLGSLGKPTPALMITVSLPATTGPTKLRLAGSAAGPNPQVYLGAVTIR